MLKSNQTFDTFLEFDEGEKDVSVNFDWQGPDESVGSPGGLDLCEVVIIKTGDDILNTLTEKQIKFLKEEADKFLTNLFLEEQDRDEALLEDYHDRNN